MSDAKSADKSVGMSERSKPARWVRFDRSNPAVALNEMRQRMFWGIMNTGADPNSDLVRRINTMFDGDLASLQKGASWAEVRSGLVMATCFLEPVSSLAQRSPGAAALKLFQVMLQRDPLNKADDGLLRRMTEEINKGVAATGKSKKDEQLTPRFEGVAAAAGIIYNSEEFREGMIDDLYSDLLGRPADNSGLEFYRKQLESGRTIGEVERSIRQSEEFLVRQLRQTYAEALGRPARNEEIQDNLQRLRAGGRIDDLRDSLILSPENRRRNPQGYLQSLNGLLAGQALEPAIVQILTGRLANGSLSMTEFRYQLARSEAFFHHVESLRGSYPQQIVKLLYMAYLDRLPDAGGLENYLRQLRRGRPVREIAAEIGGSQEARETAIRQLYPELLDREVDDSGFAHYPQELQRRPLTDIANEIRRNDGGWRRKYPNAPQM